MSRRFKPATSALQLLAEGFRRARIYECFAPGPLEMAADEYFDPLQDAGVQGRHYAVFFHPTDEAAVRKDLAPLLTPSRIKKRTTPTLVPVPSAHPRASYLVAIYEIRADGRDGYAEQTIVPIDDLA